eukprot:gnl/Spiro4/6071_TR3113_c0_g1_i1.p1 gnl/Spiro4/6071_TR3113_c0_g1~~gnl/Spiro4/6071_TR3113_c0_g1_i1.p1  ORF type:complete len:406 (+),score=32.92 gnl/Spiro4/6071_TR3113_c0_g1_i1:31-1218(+)
MDQIDQRTRREYLKALQMDDARKVDQCIRQHPSLAHQLLLLVNLMEEQYGDRFDDLQDHLGFWIPLHVAAYHGSKRCVKTLLAHKAGRSCVSVTHKTAEDIARLFSGKPKVAQMLGVPGSPAPPPPPRPIHKSFATPEKPRFFDPPIDDVNPPVTTVDESAALIPPPPSSPQPVIRPLTVDESAALIPPPPSSPQPTLIRPLTDCFASRSSLSSVIPPSSPVSCPDDEHDRIFISYSSMDKAFVFLLAASLKQEGLNISIDKEFINVGDNWQESIAHQIEICRCAILVLSPNFYASVPCLKELTLLSERRDQHKTNPDGHPLVFFPINLISTPIPVQFRFGLAGLQYADCADKDFERNLVRSIKRVLNPSAPRSSSPCMGSLATSPSACTTLQHQ